MTRALVHRGHVPASAAVLAPALVGLDEARRRVLATWEPGATLNALGDDEWLLRWPCPRRLDAATAPGLLLVLDRGALSAFPLDLPAPGAVIRMRGGATVIEAPGPPLDPAQWLDVSGFSVAEVRPLGPAPLPTRAPVPEPVVVNVRQSLGVPAAAASAQQLLAALTRRKAPATAPSAATSALTTVGGFVMSVLRMLSGAPAIDAPSPPRSPRSTWLDAAWARLTRWMAASPLHAFARLQHARYLRRLLGMFDRGDTDDALRHAIPLSNEVSEGLGRAALGFLAPRLGLGLNLGSLGAGPSVGFGPDLFEHLRRTYRAAFERLVAQQRWDEAAFVLAELLQAHEEAVSFLERHGRLRLAAEIAEARDLPPGLVVRQWWLAGGVTSQCCITRSCASTLSSRTR